MWRSPEDPKFITDPVKFSCNYIRCFCREKIRLEFTLLQLDLLYVLDENEDFSCCLDLLRCSRVLALCFFDFKEGLMIKYML